MPSGTYVVAGRSEAFSCAPGPAGWRYASEVLDLLCDRRFRTARVQVTDVDTRVRGGRTLLDDGTPVLSWVATSDPSAERHAVADVVEVASPGALVALARRVSGPGERPVSLDLAAVRFEPPALAGLSVRLRVSRAGAERHDALLAERWHVDDLDAGTRTMLYLAGDVVLWAAREGHEAWEVELVSLDGPPSRLSPATDPR